MNRDQIIRWMWFGFAFILVGFGSCQVWATQMPDGDTLQLHVVSSTVYPGHFKAVSVTMNTPVAIQWFKIHITLGGWWERLKFKTMRIYDDTLTVPLDTCPDPDTVCTVDTCKCCDTCQIDTCECFVLDSLPVRECYIDTAGSLINHFKTVTCHGSIEDIIYHPDYITVTGRARDHQPIPPTNGNFQLLFKFGVDLSCFCDADTGRKIYFLISTGPSFTNFSDTMGIQVPFKYDPIGELFAWWSRPGDANNDSAVDAADVVHLINYLYLHGPLPCVMESGDVDSTGEINATDAVYLQNYLYLHGPNPKRGYGCLKKEEE
jgi:hypothetical protein